MILRCRGAPGWRLNLKWLSMVCVCLLNDGKASFSVKYSGCAYTHVCGLYKFPSAHFLFLLWLKNKIIPLSTSGQKLWLMSRLIPKVLLGCWPLPLSMLLIINNWLINLIIQLLLIMTDWLISLVIIDRWISSHFTFLCRAVTVLWPLRHIL